MDKLLIQLVLQSGLTHSDASYMLDWRRPRRIEKIEYEDGIYYIVIEYPLPRPMMKIGKVELRSNDIWKPP